MSVIKLQHLLGQPTRYVYAVGDVADRNFLFHPPRPQRRPHSSRNVAVKLAHGVGAARNLEADDRHRERFVVILRLDTSQTHELLVTDTELIAQRTQMLLDEP